MPRANICAVRNITSRHLSVAVDSRIGTSIYFILLTLFLSWVAAGCGHHDDGPNGDGKNSKGAPQTQGSSLPAPAAVCEYPRAPQDEAPNQAATETPDEQSAGSEQEQNEQRRIVSMRALLQIDATDFCARLIHSPDWLAFTTGLPTRMQESFRISCAVTARTMASDFINSMLSGPVSPESNPREPLASGWYLEQRNQLTSYCGGASGEHFPLECRRSFYLTKAESSAAFYCQQNMANIRANLDMHVESPSDRPSRAIRAAIPSFLNELCSRTINGFSDFLRTQWDISELPASLQ